MGSFNSEKPLLLCLGRGGGHTLAPVREVGFDDSSHVLWGGEELESKLEEVTSACVSRWCPAINLGIPYWLVK